MTGVELIMAALVAGAGVGAGDAAKAAVLDAYTGLRNVLRRRLAGRPSAVQVLDAESTDPEEWRARLGAELTVVGAHHDEEVLAIARQLLELADPAGIRTGRYDLDLRGAQQPQVGDNSVRIGTSYGPVAGTMTGPVTVMLSGQPPIPPQSPEA
ncbi:hypothetical protein [Plantactinospora endophytica]|uniref:Uncharacterized protein n=1 Tax=Plantactinospora endophytica TaxID=673535 RepID=A0ABQ4DZ00_9ACTN|nr:hypothetical protein [Plantactinospora endophytica]GIG87648.1 hypothetical protein Pen02_25840 [Plantactinospora endophytica]